MPGEKLGEAVLELRTDDKGLDTGIQKAHKSADQLQAKFEAAARKMSDAGRRMTMAVTLPIIAIGAAALKSTADMEMLTASFTTMLGSAEAATNMIDKLTTMSAKTPFQMTDLAKGAQTMLAFGIAEEKILPNLKMLGDIAQGDAEKLKSLTLAFSQIQSTGRLMGQDLLQLINAGFNPLQVISEQTGKSMATLKDEMSKGAISAEMVADAFRTATEEGGRFYGGMERASQTLAGQWSTLKDNLGILARSFGEILLPQLKEFVGKITEMVQKFTLLDDSQKKMIMKFAAVAAAMGPVLLISGKVVGAILAIKTAVLALNTALAANPYILAIAGIVALGTAIFALTKNMRQENRERKELMEKQDQGIELTYEEEMKLIDLEMQRLRHVKAMQLQALETSRSLGQGPEALALIEANIRKTEEAVAQTALHAQSLSMDNREATKLTETIITLNDAMTGISGTTGGGSTTPPPGGSGGDSDAWSRADWAFFRLERLAESMSKVAPAKEGGSESSGFGGVMSGFGFGPFLEKLNAATQAFGSFLGPLMSSIGALSSVQMVLNPLSTILKGMMDILGPAIDKVLTPIIGILLIIGQTIGQILMPILDALMPIIEALAKAFVWLYNKIVVPVGTFLMKVFTGIGNGLIGLVNGVIKIINAVITFFGGRALATLGYLSMSAAMLAPITYEDLTTTGSAAIAEANGTTGGSASYNQVRPIENYFYIEDNMFNGAGGLQEFIITLDEVWRDANHLGLVPTK